MTLLIEPSSEQKLALQKTISDIMNQLLPVDQIPNLDRGEAYLLCNFVSEVIGHVESYANIAWAHFHSVNRTRESRQANEQDILLRKIERALSNRGLDISNLLSSLNESDVSK